MAPFGKRCHHRRGDQRSYAGYTLQSLTGVVSTSDWRNFLIRFFDFVTQALAIGEQSSSSAGKLSSASARMVGK